jgi:hypothetical protein
MFCPHYQCEQFYVNEPAVTDRNLITTGGLVPMEFAFHIFKKLDVMTLAIPAIWHGLFTTWKPEFYYALMESLDNTR